MIIWKKAVANVLVLAACVALIYPVGYASARGVKNGWDSLDGKTYYYVDGEKIREDSTIDGVRHRFDSNGVCLGTYTGRTKDSKYHYYYIEGVRQTGWQEIGGDTYYYNRDGIRRTGWMTISEEPYAYDLGEDGIWDGVQHFFTGNYKPSTLEEYLLDVEYSADAKYQAKIASGGKWKPVTDASAYIGLLEGHKDVELVFGTEISFDESETPEGIYVMGSDDIFIAQLDENDRILGGRSLYITRDKKGRCYLYSPYYNFGIKLKNNDAYDTIFKTIAP